MEPAAVRARVAPALLQDYDAVWDEFVLESGSTDPLAFVAHLREWDLVTAELVAELLAPPIAAERPASRPGRGVLPFVDRDDDDDEGATHVMPGGGELDGDAVTDEALVDARVEDDDEPTTSEVVEAETLHIGDRRALLASLVATRTPEVLRPTPEPAPVAASPVAPTPPVAATPAPVAATPAPVAEAPAPVAAPSLPPEPTTESEEREESARRARFRKVTGGHLRQTGGYEEDHAEARPRRPGSLPTDPGGRYEFVGTVGEGAMGRVHLANDQHLRRRVAYKEMTEDLLTQPVLASRFQAEARITAQLDHPGVVPVYSLEGDRAYTMRLVEGRTLSGLLAEARAAREARRPVPKAASRERLLELFVAVCDTVAYAHARGVLHRDLKPDNVMVGAFGEAYVMDWGIAKVVDAGVSHPVDMGTVEDEGELVIGTPGHMSPEQANGRNDRLDARSDQYALGLVLFEILTLRPALTGKTALALVTRQQEGEVNPLVHAFGERIPRELAAIVGKALSASPAHRYADLGALADDVRRALRGEPVAARPEGPITRLARRLARHSEGTLVVLLMLVLGTLVTAGAGVGFAWWQATRASAREQAMTGLLTTAAHQASVTEGQLLKLQGLLSVVTTTAPDALRQVPAGGAPEGWYAADFASAATAPPDAEEQGAGTKYGPGLVSPRHPVWLVAPGASREAVGPSARALLPTLERHLPTLLLRSHDEARATVGGLVRRTVLEVPIPARWIWVALDDGLYGSYPGHGGWPEGFDFRTTEAWKRGHDSRAPRWGAPAMHPSGRATVLTVTQALVDEADAVVGAAGVDIGLDWAKGNLLLPPELHRDGVEGYLLDEDGRVMVESDPSAGEAERLFDVPAVVDAIRERRSGERQDGDAIVLFHRLPSNGWYHVVRGPESVLLP